MNLPSDDKEIAITLGIKKEERRNYSKEQLYARVQLIFHKIGGWKYLLYSIEDYSTTGYHVHIYYYGTQIYWKTFNKLWEIGYVKNKTVYDTPGWITYVKKQNDYKEYGNPPTVTKMGIIEEFMGMSVEEYCEKIKHEKWLQYTDSYEFTPDDVIEYIEDDDHISDYH